MSDKKCSAEKKAEMEDVTTQVSDGEDDRKLFHHIVLARMPGGSQSQLPNAELWVFFLTGAY